MTDPICQVLEDIEGLLKRCYHLQKSNNEMLDYSKDDEQMNEFIDENEKIIEKYHRKINEIVQMIKENGDEEKEFQWSPIAQDYRRKEEEEKRAFDEKKRRLVEQSKTSATISTNDDQGMFL